MIKRVLVLLPLVLAASCGGKDSVYEPPAELVEFTPSLELNRIWTAKVGESGKELRLALSPATDGATIFAGTRDGRIRALNAETGREVWKLETKLPLSAGPGYGDGMLIFGTIDGDVLALDAATGEERWRVSVGSEVLATPAVDDAAVVLRTVDGRLHTLEPDSGTERWVDEQTLPSLAIRGDTAPQIAGQTVVAGWDNGRVGAYSISDGTPLWELTVASPTGANELERLVDIAVDLKIVGNDIYTTSYHGRAARVDLTTGQGVWQFEVSSYAGLGVDVTNVYVTDEFSAIIALSRRDGTELWRQEGLRLRDVTAGTRFGAGLFVGDFEGYIHGLDPRDGAFIARAKAADGRITDAPLVVGNRLFVQSDDGTVAAFTLVSDGE